MDNFIVTIEDVKKALVMCENELKLNRKCKKDIEELYDMRYIDNLHDYRVISRVEEKRNKKLQNNIDLLCCNLILPLITTTLLSLFVFKFGIPLTLLLNIVLGSIGIKVITPIYNKYRNKMLNNTQNKYNKLSEINSMNKKRDERIESMNEESRNLEVEIYELRSILNYAKEKNRTSFRIDELYIRNKALIRILDNIRKETVMKKNMSTHSYAQQEGKNLVKRF